MKNLVVLALTFIGGALTVSTAEATPSATSGRPMESDLLDKVSAVYKGYKTIRADFTFAYFQNEQDLIGHTEEGKLLLDQVGGKYRISTSSQELISDGVVQWAVLKDAEEVQVTEAGNQNGSITPLNVFSFFNKGYTVQSLGAETNGGLALSVIELTPDDRRKTYSKIKLRINQSNNHIVDVTVFDKNNSRYRYTIRQLKANDPIAAKEFVFDPAEFPGMEIVDLR